MRSVPSNTYNVLLNAPENGISVRDFVWIVSVDGTDSWGFYSGIEPAISLDVMSAATGATETRTYRGAGTLQNVGDIKLSVGLSVYNVSLTLSNIDSGVLDMVRSAGLRNGRIEIHRGIIDPTTDQLADPPIVHFYGTVNQANPKRPGGVEVICTSITNELTRNNPAMFSDATISRRNGDRFMRYAEAMANVRLPWGVAS